MSKWRKALALPRAERALLIEAAQQLLRAWVMLRLLPFKQITATLVRKTAQRGTPDIRKVRWAVETAARNLPIALTCLPQAFAASWMLLARGGAPYLHYGVAKTQTGFEAHAWVELEGRPVIGHRADGRFTLLTTFPAGDEEPR